MCKCEPNKRTPFCGKQGCEWPERPAPADLKTNTEEVLKQPDLIETICNHIACGGNLIDLSAMWHTNHWLIMRWIGEDATRDKLHKAACMARAEWYEEMVMRELKFVAFVDIRHAYNRQGDIRPMHELPESLARAISSIDTDEITEWDAVDKCRTKVGETKKLKLHSKLDALKMIGDYRGMWRKADIGNLGKTLEDLIAGSNEKPPEEKPSV